MSPITLLSATPCDRPARSASLHILPADYALVNPHDAEVSETVQITRFRTASLRELRQRACRAGVSRSAAHGTLVLVSREMELGIVRLIGTAEAMYPVQGPG